MSLNGLDHASVVEAYQASLAEAGGWFLLRYVSRDSVELLQRGPGGVSEARTAIAQYEDPSPLFGFLLYRRRKVLIKYVPEATSRLLQARVAVHFQTVTDKFTPHDTVFEISAPEQLTESGLASACALHCATGSSGSNGSSSKNKKLDGITEDAEEGPAPESKSKESEDGRPASPSVNSTPIRSLVDAAAERPMTASSAAEKELPPSRPTTATSQTTIETTRPPLTPTMTEPTYASSVYSAKAYDFFTQEHDRRMSSQTVRPTASDLASSGYYNYKPKVRLGPRPSLDPDKRPRTSGSSAGGSSARPVSTLPAGLRAAAVAARNKTPKLQRTKSRESVNAMAPPTPTILVPPPLPASPYSPSPAARPASNHSNATVSPMSTRPPAVTPEKQRLMKALELRKRQQQAVRERAKREVEAKEAEAEAQAKAETDAQTKAEAQVKAAAAAESAPAIVVNETKNEPSQDESPPEKITITDPERDIADAETTADTTTATHTQAKPRPASPPEFVKDDSGVQIVVRERSEHDSDDRSVTLESSPVSLKDSSPPSTRPSSVSEAEEPDESATPKKSATVPQERYSTATIQGRLEEVADGGDRKRLSEQYETEDEEHTPTQTEGADSAETVEDEENEHNLTRKDEEEPATVVAGEKDGSTPTLMNGEVHPAEITVSDEGDPSPAPKEVHRSTMKSSEEDQSAPMQSNGVPEQLGMNIELGQPVMKEGTTLLVEHKAKSRPVTIVHYATQPQAEPAGAASKTQHMDGTPTKSNKSEDETTLSALNGQAVNGTITSSPFSHRRTPSNLKEKRHATVDPIQVDLAAESSDVDYLSDDSFMEELQSAEVREAKPVSVSKSPMTPFFPRHPDSAHRSISVSTTPGQLSPDQNLRDAAGRSLSATHVGVAPRSPGDQVAVPKKINVSSGISQRIKALTELSKKGDSPPPAHSAATSPDVSPSSAGVRKSSWRTPPARTPPGATAAGTPSRQGSPSVYRVQEGPAAPQPNSVSVTARIVRDPRAQKPDLLPPTDIAPPLELHQSPVTISHHKGASKSATAAVSLSITAPIPPAPSRSMSDTVATNLAAPSQSREPSSPSGRPSSESSRWRPRGRHTRTPSARSGSASADPSRAHSTSSLNTDDGNGTSPATDGTDSSAPTGRRASRTSRLLKRMSSSLSGAAASSRRLSLGASATSPTYAANADIEEEQQQQSLAPVPEPPAPAALGDLNVQFPDTLLWKRRWAEIDGAGHLVLRLAGAQHSRAAAHEKPRRYPLSDLAKAPFAPDQEVMEMPHSVVCEFADGRVLQCACESGAGQARALGVLRERWAAWRAWEGAQ